MEYIRINAMDNVAVALAPLKAGKTCLIHENHEKCEGLPVQPTQETSIVLKEDLGQGHKFAVTFISAGAEVMKYGNPIGIAKENISPGQWVHTHNLKTGLGGLLDYTYEKVECEQGNAAPATFQGYPRTRGRAGIRNEIWIIPTVGCVNSVASAIQQEAQALVGGSLEAVCAFPHPYGCSQMGGDQEHTRQILADLVNHPNAGGVLVLGLGCENSNIGELKKYIGDYDSRRVKFLEAQSCEDEVEEALRLLKELAAYVKTFRREPVDAGELIIGMKCGGSDGLSGITANPAVGAFSDHLIACGGTTILTEVPEMFGAERLLMNRCENPALFQKTVALINDFKGYFKSHGQTIYENPSPGNKEGGISTLEDKSLGCTQKSGKATIKGVLAYGERVLGRGLHLLSAPGNDLAASTALAASGAQMVLFTTGRGTPFASPVPTVKISTNTRLADKKRNWIDFSCGGMTEGVTLEETAEALFRYVLEVASGKQVKAEEMGYHDMAIWKQGVTL